MLRRRNLLVNKSDSEYVDLGLPSGLRWAKGNLLKSGNDWKIADNNAHGDFWSWGNVGDSSSTGYMPSSGGVMNQTMYDSTVGKQLTSNIPVNAAYDVARNRLGYPWRLPTKEDFDELINNTDYEKMTNGWKFMKKTDHSVYIFFRFSGWCNDDGLGSRNYYCCYWSSTFSSSSRACSLSLDGLRVKTDTTSVRYWGFPIRPVQIPHRTVTITLTGDTIEGINLTLTDSEGTQHTVTTDASGISKFTLVAYGSATLSVDGKEFSPNPITVSASAGSFTVTMSEARFVDLGLPSGLKWAKGNLKKSGDTCVIGEETDYGDFWSWANVGLTNDTGWMDAAGGKMTQTMYNSTNGKNQSANISGTDAAYDVAYKYLGAPWRLPTNDECQELINNTDHEWTTINGVYGRKFKKKTDPSVYVFFPASGYCSEDWGLLDRGTYGHYWSSAYVSSSGALSLFFNSSQVGTGNFNARYYGYSIRPVK